MITARLVLTLAAFGGAVAYGSDGSSRAGTLGPTVCLSGDGISNYVLNQLKSWVSDATLPSTTGLPNVSPSAVTVLTDSATCARVLTAYNSILSRAVTQFYVWQVGPFYVARDTAGHRGDRSAYLVLDSTLKKAGRYLD